jgi:hypothetical protein
MVLDGNAIQSEREGMERCWSTKSAWVAKASSGEVARRLIDGNERGRLRGRRPQRR